MISQSQMWRATAWALLAALVGLAISLQLAYGKQADALRWLAESQQRQHTLTELSVAVAQTETAQHTALANPSPGATRSYQSARARAQQALELYSSLHTDPTVLDASARPRTLRQLHGLIGSRLTELDVQLRSAFAADAANGVASPPSNTDADNELNARISATAAQLNAAERRSADAASTRLNGLQPLVRGLVGAVLLISVALALGVAWWLWLRSARAKDADTESPHPLSGGSRGELGALLHQLQLATEKEKAQLARSLHDELGGLLIAVKMDISWLHKRWPNPTPEIAARWERVLKVLDDGVDFKRRVVEHLRPTLLDNMGLLAALRWITQETCGPASINCTERYPEEEPLLREEVAILAFRLVQEALQNVVTHARATEVRVEIDNDDQRLTVVVEDNGVGIAPRRPGATALQGLSLMDLRIGSLGGSFDVQPTGRGTRLRAQLPSEGHAAYGRDQSEPATARRATMRR